MHASMMQPSAADRATEFTAVDGTGEQFNGFTLMGEAEAWRGRQGERQGERHGDERVIGLPGPEHFIFIPGVLLVGLTIGWILGGRAARAQIEQKRRKALE